MHQAVRVSALGLTAAVLITSVAACQSDDDKSSGSSAPAARAVPASLTGQKLDWHSCPAPTAAQGGGDKPGADWQCATLKAPRDYAQPDKGTLDVALIRKKATGPQHRIGSLVYNFGGPGGSGITTLPGLSKDYETLNSRYDLVSFDPRGVGASAGVKCLDDKATDASYQRDSTPDDDAELTAMDAATRKYAAACAKNSRAVLPHVDTISAARDMDLMRRVLGDKKLHYFGISYGTELGGVYAHLFPGNVGHFVLDAVVDPTEDPLQGAFAQAKGFQLALDNFMKACAGAARGQCPTGKGGAEGTRKISDFLKRLDRKPLPAAEGRDLTQDQASTGIVSALYSKESWPVLSLGLSEAMRGGSGKVLQELADSYNGRDKQGRYSNMGAANRAIGCVDDKARFSDADVKKQLPALRKASPVFGETIGWMLTGCNDWPVPGETDGPVVSAKGAAPIVVVGNTGDPATPVAGAHKMAEQLGKGVGVNVTLHGQGHGGYNSGNPCLKKAIDGYLLDGKVPAEGTVCR